MQNLDSKMPPGPLSPDRDNASMAATSPPATAGGPHARSATPPILPSANLLDAWLQATPDLVSIKDESGSFLRVSPSFAAKLNGLSPAQAVGLSDLNAFKLECCQRILTDDRAVWSSGQPVENQPMDLEWRDAPPQPVLITRIPQRNDAGRIETLLTVIRDNTPLRNAEITLQATRDAALTSAQAKSQFLANMSHEIRTPMNAIIGMTGLLLGTRLDEEQRDFSQTIRTSAEGLLHIINDVLDFTRIEARKLSLEHREFDLEETVESVLELFGNRASEKHIELGCFIDPQVPRQLRGDPGRLRQVLTNLIHNALKFTETGEVQVAVQRVEARLNSIHLMFSVRDTGIGIPADAVSRLFNAFQQVDGSSTRSHGGTGLGLAISRQLVELMGGTIRLETVPGVGSRFWFTVPLEPVTPPAGLTPRPNPLAAAKGKRILLATGFDSVLATLETYLRPHELICTLARSGPQAFETLREAAHQGAPFDLMVFDLDLPAMDGIALAQSVRSQPELHQTRLMMLSPTIHRVDPSFLRAIGLVSYATKPIRRSRFLESVAIAMADGVAPAQPSVPTTPLTPAGQTQDQPDRQPLQTSAEPSRVTEPQVLLVEDNTVNRKVTLRQLHKLGVPAVFAENGLQAVEAVRKAHYPVILMDCQMPEMDGYQATREIRRLEALRELEGHRPAKVHIIAMTANAMEGDRERCIAVGMDDYISKPARIEDLEASIRRIPAAKPGGTGDPEPDPTAVDLDWETLDALREISEPSGPDSLSGIIELFLTKTPDYIARIDAALAGEDPANLRNIAHSLKGSATNLGARNLARLAESLEGIARQGHLQQATTLAHEIRDEVRSLGPILRRVARGENLPRG